MNVGLIDALCGIIIVAIIAVVVYWRLKSKKDVTKSAEEFLDGLKDVLGNRVTEIITNSDPTKYDTLDKYEAAVLNDIYDAVWDYVDAEAKKAFADNLLAEVVVKAISQEMITDFVNAIIDSISAKDTMAEVYTSANTNKIEAEDKELEEKYSDQEEYVENSDAADLEPAVEEVHTEDEVANINPQKDEEEEFNVEDDSQEVITDKPIIVTSTDKNGNTLYYEIAADGKKKRVSKDYALKNM